VCVFFQKQRDVFLPISPPRVSSAPERPDIFHPGVAAREGVSNFLSRPSPGRFPVCEIKKEEEEEVRSRGRRGRRGGGRRAGTDALECVGV